MLIPMSYVREFPMIPGGGLFFIPIGLCIVAGALVARARMMLVWVGLALGIVAILLGGRFLEGLPPPSTAQVAFFVAAIVAEVIAFRVAMPRVRPAGLRPTLLVTLAIVGGHFLVMVPAFGLPILVLALLCLGNAATAWRMPAYPVSAAWFVDGLFKTCVGVAMWLASPAFGGGGIAR